MPKTTKKTAITTKPNESKPTKRTAGIGLLEPEMKQVEQLVALECRGGATVTKSTFGRKAILYYMRHYEEAKREEYELTKVKQEAA